MYQQSHLPKSYFQRNDGHYRKKLFTIAKKKSIAKSQYQTINKMHSTSDKKGRGSKVEVR